MPLSVEANELPVLWRTKLRSTISGVDHAQQVKHCVDRSLIGIGWRLEELPTGSALYGVLKTIESMPEVGWGPKAAHIVRRCGVDAKIGDFVWTRDTFGCYLLCRITGPYHYDDSDEAKAVDVHQTRPVEWAPRPLNGLEVPGGVIRCFVGTGTSFSRIHDIGARILTGYLWEKLCGRSLPELALGPHDVLASHLDPYDVEDLVYVWLQVERDYIALPRARQRDTPAYEWTMINRASRRRGSCRSRPAGSLSTLRLWQPPSQMTRRIRTASPPASSTLELRLL